MKDKKHKVRINLANQDDGNLNIIESVVETFPNKLFKKLFGKHNQVLIIAPSESVTGVEIYENGGEKNANTHKAQ
jgi:hypothetical protein